MLAYVCKDIELCLLSVENRYNCNSFESYIFMINYSFNVPSVQDTVGLVERYINVSLGKMKKKIPID